LKLTLQDRVGPGADPSPALFAGASLKHGSERGAVRSQCPFPGFVCRDLIEAPSNCIFIRLAVPFPGLFAGASLKPAAWRTNPRKAPLWGLRVARLHAGFRIRFRKPERQLSQCQATQPHAFPPTAVASSGEASFAWKSACTGTISTRPRRRAGADRSPTKCRNAQPAAPAIRRGQCAGSQGAARLGAARRRRSYAPPRWRTECGFVSCLIDNRPSQNRRRLHPPGGPRRAQARGGSGGGSVGVEQGEAGGAGP
jgi:hypothetical protein